MTQRGGKPEKQVVCEHFEPLCNAARRSTQIYFEIAYNKINQNILINNTSLKKFLKFEYYSMKPDLTDKSTIEHKPTYMSTKIKPALKIQISMVIWTSGSYKML